MPAGHVPCCFCQRPNPEARVNSVKTGADFLALDRLTYIKCVQTYFDGFLMGAKFALKKTEDTCPFDCDHCRED